MNLRELNIDGFMGTGALTDAIPETDLCKVPLLAPHTMLDEGPPPEYQIMVANGQLESSIATTKLQIEIGHFTFEKKYLVMTNLKSPLIGFSFSATVQNSISVKGC